MQTQNGTQTAVQQPVQSTAPIEQYRPSTAPLSPTTLGDAIELAKMLARSEIIPKEYREKPGNVLSAIMMGQDLGISPMQAMREIYVVEGRPASSALLKVALVKQSPLCLRWELIESTDTQATFETHRRGESKPTRHTYTLKDAQQAGLYPGRDSSNWSKRPKLMLRRRCESELADEVYPDVVKGLRTEDEAEEIRERAVVGARVEIDHSQVQAPTPQTSSPTVSTSTASPPPREAPGAEHFSEAAAEPQPKEAALDNASAAAPDPAEVLLLEISQAAKSDMDAILKRAGQVAPKGHPLRAKIGEAINLRKRELGS